MHLSRILLACARARLCYKFCIFSKCKRKRNHVNFGLEKKCDFCLELKEEIHTFAAEMQNSTQRSWLFGITVFRP